MDSSKLLLKKQKAQNLALRTDLEYQQRQLQDLTEQLLTRDRKIVQLEKALSEVKQENATLVEELQQTQIKAQTIQAIHDAIITEREHILAPIIASQKEQLTQFSQDLQAINKESLDSARTIGMLGQEKLLAEKLKSRDLELEIKNLQEQIKDLQQTLLKTKNLQIPLQNRLKQQEQLIANCLDPKKVEQLKRQESEMSNV